jgi:hypothetical protein
VLVAPRRCREQPHGTSLCRSIQGRRRNIRSPPKVPRGSDAIEFGGGAVRL